MKIENYTLPHTAYSLAELQAIKRHDKKQLTLNFAFPIADIAQQVSNDLQQRLDKPIKITLDWHTRSHKVQKSVPAINGVKNIIAIASGKGGVGKSTTTVNLALALQAQGAKVGVLDADIYGPSIPTMLGIHDKPESRDGNSIEPNIAHGLQVMSIGFLVDQKAAMIWRGPMVSNALKQLLNDTRWRDLDYLLIDLPPGTGDIQLTMAQKIPVSGGVIVTTPQNIALQDAKRALQMFRKVDIATLGIIENMSYHTCSNCGHQEAIFGTGGGQQFANDYELPLLGRLPLLSQIREQADQGKPSVMAQPDSEEAQRYRYIARQLAIRLSLRPENHAAKFPPIRVK